MSDFLSIALRWPVVRRACGFALIVGSILVAINHGPALLSGTLDRGRMLQIALTVVVPYLVSTISSVLAIRDLEAAE